MIKSAAWWKAAALRALRTAVVIAVPYVIGSSLLGIPWLSVGSAAVLGAFLSFLTSLAGIAEAVGSKVPVWLALLERVTKTAAQSTAAGIGTAVLVQDVDWSQVLQAAAIAALGSLLIGVLGYLPEATVPGSTSFDSAPPAAVAAPVPVAVTPTVPAPSDPDQPAAGVPPARS